MKNVIKTMLSVVCLIFLTVSLYGSVYAADSKLKTPDGFSVSNYGGSIKVEWNKVSGAKLYQVYCRTDGKLSKLATVKQNSYMDENVKVGKAYRYYVRAYADKKYSSFSEGKAIYHMIEPTHSSIKVKSDAIHFSWNKVSGAQKYYVFRKTGSSSWEHVTSVKSDRLYYYDKNVSHGRTYEYTVSAVKGNSMSSVSNVSTATWLAPGEITKISNTAKGIKLQWKSFKGVTRYILYRKKGNETSWTRLGTFSGLTYTDTNVVSGVKYTYTLVNGNSNTVSGYKSPGFSKVYLSAPKTVKLSHSPEGVKINWSKVEKSDGYAVYRKVSGESSYKRIATLKGENNRYYYDGKASFGKVNYYRVCAYTSGLGAGCLSTAAEIRALDPKKKAVALTFDDGPYTPVTNQILDCLEKYNSRATFFVVGSRVESYKDCIIRAYNMGNEIGNHTYNHANLRNLSASGIAQEINRTNALIKKYTGENAKVVRAPGGAVNDNVKAAVKYPLVNWSVDTLDWKTRDKASTVSAIKNNVRDGSIVLMHDLYRPTADAACEIIPWLCKNGYQLVTVSELMQLKGRSFKAGGLYYSAS